MGGYDIILSQARGVFEYHSHYIVAFRYICRPLGRAVVGGQPALTFTALLPKQLLKLCEGLGQKAGASSWSVF
ncbi:MAG: hypothetical protein CVU11_16255 [Bacteroidetes bacterium HGW-Bacteroidetes-6]|nr:MAG: hypothetical protein CVU11_16255 [Bacteroidetes bacterium HGW-Bacteroidetes-6]